MTLHAVLESSVDRQVCQCETKCAALQSYLWQRAQRSKMRATASSALGEYAARISNSNLRL